MVLRQIRRLIVAGALLLVVTDGALAQRAASLALLGRVERGQWQLTERSGTGRSMCLTAPARLLQLGHGGAACEQVVESEDQNSATIRYACPGHGHGRTVISVDTPRVISIETQGVADGAPFILEYEGRRTGNCG
jgi:hypothetical protein